ncbi:MAG: TonB-dependent receptor [Gemmatimonadota bacterium]|jgi:iron complex outermembrane receptor protein
MSLSARTFLTALLLAGTAASAAAQQGTIAGRILDGDTRRPLEGAQVQVGSAATQADDQGAYSIGAPEGLVTVTVVAIGYVTTQRTLTVVAGQTADLDILVEPDPIAMSAVTVTATRDATPERSTAVPAAFDVRTSRDIEVQPSRTVGDLVVDMPGVDAPQSGIQSRNIVTRGFNNVFSGALLVLTDYRYARVPSLRLNAYNMIPAPALDMERVEVVLGPASALYGPNSANGILHVITASPIDEPGTSVSIGGGNRSIFTGAFRQAFRFNEQLGAKVTGQYFRGHDFEYQDPFEVPDPANPLIAARDFDVERWGGEARVDYRPWEDSDDGLTVAYGLNQLVNSIELTGIGAGQAKDWKYQYGQVLFRRSGLFAQAFVNASNAGETYLLRTGNPIVDESNVIASQLQYAFAPIDRLDLTTGVDFSKTTPKTKGTITGSNEDSDGTIEYGAYVSARLELAETLDLVAALRMDDHEHLEDKVWSPRVGLVYEPAQGHAFRATYNRAFSTPTTNNLFLDISSGTIPVVPGFGYDIRTLGVPESGFTWNDQCAGGVSSYCMYSPFAPGMQLPATGAALWDALVLDQLFQNPATAPAIAAMGLDSATFRTALSGPTPADLTSVLRRFDHESIGFPLDATGPTRVDRIRPTITNSYEVGYQGLVAGRVRLSASVYRNDIHDFVGPLRVETPSVFLDGTSVATYMTTRLVGAGADATVASGYAAAAAGQVAMVPFGTVAPDQRDNSALILTYRNFGDVTLWGADIGFEAALTDRISALGSYSWVNDDCFDQNGDGLCQGSIDLALNAPEHKGSFGLRFRDRGVGGSGLELGGRVRYSGGFPMNSGVYIGEVREYTAVDANVAYEVPSWEGFLASLSVNNITLNPLNGQGIFEAKHQEFIGAPAIGPIVMLQLTYELGAN